MNKLQKFSGKTFLYIDGTNLLAGLIKIFGYKKIPSFASILKEIKKFYRVDRIYFYASYTPSKNVRNPKIKKQIKTELVFFNEVLKIPNLVFFKGYRSPTSKKEKAVDVHLAVDIVKDAFLGRYKSAIIFTGDADQTYSVQIVRNLGLPIYALFIPTRFSLPIAYKAVSPKILDYKGIFQKYNKVKGKIRKLSIVKIKDPVRNRTG